MDLIKIKDYFDISQNNLLFLIIFNIYVDKLWSCVQFRPHCLFFYNFDIFQKCCFTVFYAFLPQQFLYFLPLPHVLTHLVYIVYIVFILLSVFQWLHRQVTIYIYSIYSIYFIICIYLLRTNCEHCSQYFILLINGY